MALQQLQYIRSLIRNAIREPVEKNFPDLELDNLINLGQYDVARRLLKINKAWFATKATVTLTNSIGTIPTDCLQIEAITSSDSAKTPFTELSLSDIGLLNSVVYTASTDDPYYAHIGSSVYTYTGDDVISSLDIYYIKKPTALSTDTDETIIPVEFVDMIIAFTVWKCAARAGLNEQQKEKEYDQMFIEVLDRYKLDIQAKTPGKEAGGR